MTRLCIALDDTLLYFLHWRMIQREEVTLCKRYKVVHCFDLFDHLSHLASCLAHLSRIMAKRQVTDYLLLSILENTIDTMVDKTTIETAQGDKVGDFKHLVSWIIEENQIPVYWCSLITWMQPIMVKITWMEAHY